MCGDVIVYVREFDHVKGTYFIDLSVPSMMRAVVVDVDVGFFGRWAGRERRKIGNARRSTSTELSVGFCCCCCV